jgi:hypothetical protein
VFEFIGTFVGLLPCNYAAANLYPDIVRTLILEDEDEESARLQFCALIAHDPVLASEILDSQRTVEPIWGNRVNFRNVTSITYFPKR